MSKFIIFWHLTLFAIRMNAIPIGNFVEPAFSVVPLRHIPKCIVASNKLYINGLYYKDLTDKEQQELNHYKEDLKKHEEKSEEIIRQAKKDKVPLVSLVSKNKGIFEGPPKPTFCNENDSIPIDLEGCTIQNKKLYVGHEFVRDLTEEEAAEIQEYEAKRRDYQQYLKSTVHNQLMSWFNRNSFDLFTLFDDMTRSKAVEVAATTTTTTATTAPLEIPVPPRICTAIY